MTQLGIEFRKWRSKHNLLLIEIAILMNVKCSDLSGWEVGRKPWPDEIRKRVEYILR